MTKSSKKKTKKVTRKASASRKAPASRSPKASRKTKKSPSLARAAASRESVDSSLSKMPAALQERLGDMKSQWEVGDLRNLGLRVLERAREISTRMKSVAQKATRVPARSVKKAK